MKEKSKISDSIICILLSFMIMSFYIFETAVWGRYVLLGISILILLIYSLTHKFKILLIYNKPFHIYMFIFSLFCLLSSIWAWNFKLAVIKGMTIFSILLCFSLIYPYFQEKGKIDLLLDAFMFSGYGMVLYTIVYYGISNITLMLNGNMRVGNDFTNANSIGLVVTTSCLIQFFYLLKRERLFYSIFLIPSIMILAISQSRKAIIMFVLGTFFLLATNSSRKSSYIKKFFNIFIAIIVFILLIYILFKLDIFSGVVKRFEVLYESINGVRKQDIRAIYREIGIQQFLKTPILGIGMGNSLELLESVGERRTYLHCNFVELLSSGGIIGFVVYYIVYIKLLKDFFKYRKCRLKTTNLCIILLILMLIMDYGMVTYYDKQQYLFFMCFFLQSDFIKKDYYMYKLKKRKKDDVYV